MKVDDLRKDTEEIQNQKFLLLNLSLIILCYSHFFMNVWTKVDTANASQTVRWLTIIAVVRTHAEWGSARGGEVGAPKFLAHREGVIVYTRDTLIFTP
jgi:hypothetical protein